MNFSRKYLAQELNRFLYVSIAPLIFLFIVIVMIHVIYETNTAEALILLWNIFSIPHFMPKEGGDIILQKLFSKSELWAIIFLIYSYMALLMFLWAMLCSHAIREEHKRKKSEVKNADTWHAWLKNHHPMFTTPSERIMPIAISPVLHAIGELKLKDVLMVLIAGIALYVLPCMLIHVVFIVLGSILSPWKEWTIISGSFLVSGFIIFWAYSLYPTRSLQLMKPVVIDELSL